MDNVKMRRMPRGWRVVKWDEVIEWPRRFKLRFAGGGLLFDLGAQFLGDVVPRLTVHQLQPQQQQIALPSAQPRASAPGCGRRG